MRRSPAFRLPLQRAATSLTAACLTAACATPSAGRATAVVSARPFAWVGTYDVVGHNFPEGSRSAVLTIERHDTAYAFAVVGPPGQLAAAHIAGDSAQLMWDLGPSGDLMTLDLRGAGDSLTGTWRIDQAGGPVRARRRPPAPSSPAR